MHTNTLQATPHPPIKQPITKQSNTEKIKVIVTRVNIPLKALRKLANICSCAILEALWSLQDHDRYPGVIHLTTQIQVGNYCTCHHVRVYHNSRIFSSMSGSHIQEPLDSLGKNCQFPTMNIQKKHFMITLLTSSFFYLTNGKKNSCKTSVFTVCISAAGY